MENAEPCQQCVVLADRHVGVTEGVRGLLAGSFETVVTVADAVSLRAALVRMHPGMAVIDFSITSEIGTNWLRAVRTDFPDVWLVVLIEYEEPSVRRAVLDAGADAVVLKRALSTELVPAVERMSCVCRVPHGTPLRDSIESEEGG